MLSEGCVFVVEIRVDARLNYEVLKPKVVSRSSCEIRILNCIQMDYLMYQSDGPCLSKPYASAAPSVLCKKDVTTSAMSH